MLFGKKKHDLVRSVAHLENVDYSKNPELGNIFKRISDGRIQFEEAFSNDIQAVNTTGRCCSDCKILRNCI